MQDLLEGLTKKGRVVGLDFVEVAPMYDLTGTTSQVAARLILDLIGFELWERERNADRQSG
jgi:agmatinase